MFIFPKNHQKVYFQVYILIMGKTCMVKIKWWNCGLGEWGLEVMFLTKIGSYTLKLLMRFLSVILVIWQALVVSVWLLWVIFAVRTWARTLGIWLRAKIGLLLVIFSLFGDVFKHFWCKITIFDIEIQKKNSKKISTNVLSTQIQRELANASNI